MAFSEVSTDKGVAATDVIVEGAGSSMGHFAQVVEACGPPGVLAEVTPWNLDMIMLDPSQLAQHVTEVTPWKCTVHSVVELQVEWALQSQLAVHKLRSVEGDSTILHQPYSTSPILHHPHCAALTA